MRPRRAGRWIGIGADVRLAGHIADRIVSEALGGGGIGGDRGRGQPVERIVGEALEEIGVAVGAGQQIAEAVVGEGEVLDKLGK
jgi:hypothetical protein